MNDLPNEILATATGIAGYLLPSDAIALNNTCKKLLTQLSLTATAPRPLIAKFSRNDNIRPAHYGFQIWVPDQVSCHSMLLSMRWKDQGWGYRKGRVLVVASEDKNHSCDCSDRSRNIFGGGRVVYTSATVLHEEQRLHIEFQPKAYETYHVWYIVGGGGGYSLHLSSVTIQALVFDDPLRSFGKACKFLAKTEVLSAYDKRGPSSKTIVKLDAEQFVQTHGEHLLTPLISFADGYYDDVSESDLQQKILGFIQSIWESWAKHCSAYEKMIAEFGPTQEVSSHLYGRRRF